MDFWQKVFAAMFVVAFFLALYVVGREDTPLRLGSVTVSATGMAFPLLDGGSSWIELPRDQEFRLKIRGEIGGNFYVFECHVACSVLYPGQSGSGILHTKFLPDFQILVPHEHDPALRATAD